MHPQLKSDIKSAVANNIIVCHQANHPAGVHGVAYGLYDRNSNVYVNVVSVKNSVSVPCMLPMGDVVLPTMLTSGWELHDVYVNKQHVAHADWMSPLKIAYSRDQRDVLDVVDMFADAFQRQQDKIAEVVATQNSRRR